jgi:hypothetical protein
MQVLHELAFARQNELRATPWTTSGVSTASCQIERRSARCALPGSVSLS